VAAVGYLSPLTYPGGKDAPYFYFLGDPAMSTIPVVTAEIREAYINVIAMVRGLTPEQHIETLKTEQPELYKLLQTILDLIRLEGKPITEQLMEKNIVVTLGIMYTLLAMQRDRDSGTPLPPPETL
jgi:hypothetical protein